MNAMPVSGRMRLASKLVFPHPSGRRVGDPVNEKEGTTFCCPTDVAVALAHSTLTGIGIHKLLVLKTRHHSNLGVATN